MSARRTNVVEGRFQRGEGRAEQPKTVRLSVACARLGFSTRTGERLLAEGKFPIPEQPRLMKRRGSPHLFSEVHLDAYIERAALRGVR